MSNKFSQKDEEIHILNYFGDKVGTFLDLGANDGVTLSNTRALALQGWSGTLVEMLPTCLKKLESTYQDRPDIQIIGKAIGPYDGYGPVFESADHLGRGDHGLISTIIEEETNRWKGTKFDNFIEGVIEYVSIETLFSLFSYQTYDFISIDIEGMDWEVLCEIDLNSYGCQFICVEFNGKEAAKYIDYCAQFGMKEIARNGENLMFTK